MREAPATTSRSLLGEAPRRDGAQRKIIVMTVSDDYARRPGARKSDAIEIPTVDSNTDVKRTGLRLTWRVTD